MRVAILRPRSCSEAKCNLTNPVDRRRFLIQIARTLDCLRGASLAPQIAESLKEYRDVSFHDHIVTPG